MICHLRVIPPKLAANFLIQICSALAYAHQRGITHRDINPSNIIVQPNDQLKILADESVADFTMGTHYFLRSPISGWLENENRIILLKSSEYVVKVNLWLLGCACIFLNRAVHLNLGRRHWAKQRQSWKPQHVR